MTYSDCKHRVRYFKFRRNKAGGEFTHILKHFAVMKRHQKSGEFGKDINL